MLWFLLGCFLSKTAVETSVDSAIVDVQVEFYPSFEYCENSIGNTACNFEAINSLDITEKLYDYYGKPIVLDLSTMWCGPCNTAAGDVQELSETYLYDDLVYLTVLIENKEGQPPTAEDVQWWLEEYGIFDPPVLASDRSLLNNIDLKKGWYLEGWPTFYLINSEMVVEGYLKGYNRETLITGIEFLTQ